MCERHVRVCVRSRCRLGASFQISGVEYTTLISLHLGHTRRAERTHSQTPHREGPATALLGQQGDRECPRRLRLNTSRETLARHARYTLRGGHMGLCGPLRRGVCTESPQLLYLEASSKLSTRSGTSSSSSPPAVCYTQERERRRRGQENLESTERCGAKDARPHGA